MPSRHESLAVRVAPHMRDGSAPRRGFSLIELLLVLALMAIVAAMVVPRLFNVEGRQTLRSAADQLSGAMVSARQSAMVSGQQIFLLYQENTPFYAIVPEPADQESMAQFERVTTVLSQAAASLSTSGVLTETIGSDVGIQHLPSGTRFLAGQFGVAQQGDYSGMQAEISGSPYVSFSPDGTSDDALMELTNEAQDRIAVTLRGLTGTARVGELLALDPYSGSGGVAGGQP